MFSSQQPPISGVAWIKMKKPGASLSPNVIAPVCWSLWSVQSWASLSPNKSSKAPVCVDLFTVPPRALQCWSPDGHFPANPLKAARRCSQSWSMPGKVLQGADIWNLKKNSFIFQMKLNIRSDQFVYKEKGWMGRGVVSAKDPNVSASSIIWSLGHVLVLSQVFFGSGTFLFLLYLVRGMKDMSYNPLITS